MTNTTYNIQESSHSTTLTEAAVAFLNKVVHGAWTQREDGKIDVCGSVFTDRERFKPFLGSAIFFGKVVGDFHCEEQSLESLKGCPEEVEGSFYCRYNNLITLEGAPLNVTEDFDCRYNPKLSLDKHLPKIGKRFIHSL